jgi:hypothetical protein
MIKEAGSKMIYCRFLSNGKWYFCSIYKIRCNEKHSVSEVS